MSKTFSIKCRICNCSIPITEVKEWISCPCCGSRIRINWGVRYPKEETNKQTTQKDDD